MAYDKVVDSSLLDSNLSKVSDAINKKLGTNNRLSFPSGFVSAINSIVAGGSGEPSNVEIVEFIPPDVPVFKHSTGEAAVWGWGIYEGSQAWNSLYYLFSGTTSSEAIGTDENPLSLSVSGGRLYGLPSMTKGKCLAILTY